MRYGAWSSNRCGIQFDDFATSLGRYTKCSAHTSNRTFSRRGDTAKDSTNSRFFTNRVSRDPRRAARRCEQLPGQFRANTHAQRQQTLQISFRLQESKIGVVSSTSSATLRQLVMICFEKVDFEDRALANENAENGMRTQRLRYRPHC